MFSCQVNEHPFYISERSDQESRPKPIGHEDLNEHWVGAGHLKVGDKIRKADGSFGTVANVTTVQETRTMYNLEVQEVHTFFVGTQGWLVHNDIGSGGCPILIGDPYHPATVAARQAENAARYGAQLPDELAKLGQQAATAGPRGCQEGI